MSSPTQPPSTPALEFTDIQVRPFYGDSGMRAFVSFTVSGRMRATGLQLREKAEGGFWLRPPCTLKPKAGGSSGEVDSFDHYYFPVKEDRENLLAQVVDIYLELRRKDQALPSAAVGEGEG